MKQIPYIMLLFSLTACDRSWKMDNTDTFSTLPAVRVRLQDSISNWDSRQLPASEPLVIILFSPDCEHCKDMTSYLLDSMRSLSNVTFLFASVAPLSDIRKFIDTFHLRDYPNIIVGQDDNFKLFNTYRVKQFPEIVIYNRRHQFSRFYTGTINLHQLTKAINS